jgi:hypothetical protein
MLLRVLALNYYLSKVINVFPAISAVTLLIVIVWLILVSTTILEPVYSIISIFIITPDSIKLSMLFSIRQELDEEPIVLFKRAASR